MKCPNCDYVSFDNLSECKKCGASFAEARQEKDQAVDSRLQEELFSLRLEDEEEEGAAPVDEPPAVEAAEETFIPEPGVSEAPGEEDIAMAADARVEEEAADDFAEEQPGFSPGEEEKPQGVELPDLRIDYDPGEVGDTLSGMRSDIETEPSREIGADAGSTVITDETVLPDDLWVEEGAGFLPRLLAFAVDSMILAALLLLFFVAAGLVLRDVGGLSSMTAPEKVSELFVPFYLLGIFLSLSYFTFFLGWAGRTPGKVLLKLDVRRTDGGRMTYSRAFLRWVGYLVSVTFAGLGFLWIFFDERKRGWHDYLSGTWVKSLRNGD
jgi:uncharacterized RDD family membrane protein YckC